MVFETEQEIVGALRHMLDSGIVVKLKNRFANPLFTGIRDCLLNVKVAGHICEVQIHLACILNEKPQMHIFYNFFRDLFASTGNYEGVMKQVEALGNLGTVRGVGEGSVAEGIGKLLREGDLVRLRGLANVLKGFGDSNLEVIVRKRVLEVLEVERVVSRTIKIF